MPKHGDTRNERTVTEFGHRVELVVPDDGHAVAYAGPACAFAYTIADRYCAHCETWIETTGILGRLRFIAEHDSGDCAKACA